MLSAALASKPEHVSIRPRGHTLGRSGARISTHPTTRVQVHLAGFAAEHLLTGRRPAQLDREVGLALLSRRDPKFRDAFTGLEECDGDRAVIEVLRTSGSASTEEIECAIERLYDVARESLTAVWSAVQSLAKALLKFEELDRDAIDRALDSADIHQPVLVVQRAHGILTEDARV